MCKHLIDTTRQHFSESAPLGVAEVRCCGQEGGEFGRNGGLFQTGDQVGQGAEVAGQAGGEFVERRLVGASPTHAEVVGGVVERGGESELRVQMCRREKAPENEAGASAVVSFTSSTKRR